MARHRNRFQPSVAERAQQRAQAKRGGPPPEPTRRREHAINADYFNADNGVFELVGLDESPTGRIVHNYPVQAAMAEAMAARIDRDFNLMSQGLVSELDLSSVEQRVAALAMNLPTDEFQNLVRHLERETVHRGDQQFSDVRFICGMDRDSIIETWITPNEQRVTTAKKSPAHIDAGKPITKARMQRSVLGVVVEDTRAENGGITRKVASTEDSKPIVKPAQSRLMFRNQKRAPSHEQTVSSPILDPDSQARSLPRVPVCGEPPDVR